MKQIFTLIVLCFSLISYSGAATRTTSANNPEFARGPIKSFLSWFQAAPQNEIYISTISDKYIPTGFTTDSVFVTLTGNATSLDVIISLYDDNDQLIQIKNIKLPKVGVINITDTFINVAIGRYYVSAEIPTGKATNTSNYFSIRSSVLNISTFNGHSACFGMTNGDFTINPGSNAVLPVTYVVRDATNTIIKNDQNPIATNLPGNAFYSITATDAIGKTGKKDKVPVGEDPQIIIQSTSSKDAAGCNNGEIKVKAIGGSGNLSYSILGCSSLTQASGDFLDLAPCPIPGGYTIKVIDTLNSKCSVSTLPIAIDQTIVPVLSATEAHFPIKCKGDATGKITITANGGSPAYTYKLTKAGVTIAPDIANPNKYSTLVAGTYIATVTDANTCVINLGSIIITEPAAALSLDLSKQDVTLCFGNTNGSITAVANGGTSATGSYTFALTPNEGKGATGPANTMNYSELGAKKFNIKVTDDNLCSINKDTTINAPVGLPLNALATTQKTTCSYTVDGKATLSATGGNAGFIPANTYSFAVANQGAAQPSTFPLTATTYTYPPKVGGYAVWVKDGQGCIDSTNFTIKAQDTVLVTANFKPVVGCSGANTGEIQTLKVTGGTPKAAGLAGYSYTLTPALNTSGDVSGYYKALVKDKYTLTAIDKNGCKGTITDSITEPEPIVITPPTITPTTCHGTATGTITVIAHGGKTGSTLSYSIRQLPLIPYILGKFSGVPTGTYSIIVTDGSCTDSVTNVKVADAPLLVLTPGTVTNVACFGGSTGTIAATAKGGTGALSFSINPNVGVYNAVSKSFTQLTANTTPGYIITVTDANLCTKSSLPIPVTQPAKGVSFKTVAITNVTTCPGDLTGVIAVTGQDGTQPYTITLTKSAVPVAPKTVTATTTTFDGLGAGNKIYTIKLVDANSCPVVPDSTVSITEPLPIIIDTLAGSVKNPKCINGSTGSLTITAKQGGILVPGTFTLTGIKSGSLAPQTTAGTAVYTDVLAADTYTVSFNSSANNCPATSSSFVLKNPTQLVVNSVQVINPTCNGATNDTIKVLASGGTGVITYKLNSIPAQSNTDGIFFGLPVNNTPGYTLTVTDANNCATVPPTQIVKINDPAKLVITSAAATNLICASAINSGTITVKVSGGTPAYTFTLNTVPTVGNNSGIFKGLAKGSYTVTVTDKYNCSPLTTIPLTVGDPTTAFDFSFTSKQAKCFGDGSEIHITPNTALPNLEYSYDNGAKWHAQKDSVGMADKTYTMVMRTKDNLCVSPLPYPTVTFATNTKVDISPAPTDVLGCFGDKTGSISLSTTKGGTGAGTYKYTYAADTTGKFVSLLPPETFSSLAGGVYKVWAKDKNGCFDTTTVKINQPAELVPIYTVKQIDAANTSGSITITNATGGTGAISYAVYPVGTTPVKYDNTLPVPTPYSPLIAGFYVVELKDSKCSTFDTVQIYNSLNVTVNSPLINCKGGNTGSISLTPIDGSANYTYTLKSLSGTVYPNIVKTDKTATAFSGLPEGTYTATVTDQSAPTAKFFTQNIIVKANDSIKIVPPSTVVDGQCDGTLGKITLKTPTGGNGVYTYYLDNTINAAGSTFSNRPAGISKITVRDANGCTSDTARILVGNASTVNLALVLVKSDDGSGDGSFTATASGGTINYEFNLDNSPTTWTTGVAPTFASYTYTNQKNGLHTVVARDANKCLSLPQVIDVPNLFNTINATITVNNSNKCKGDKLSSVKIHVNSGGIPPYSITVTDSKGNLMTPTTGIDTTFQNLGTGDYDVLITDASSPTQKYISSFKITDGSNLSFNTLLATTPVCYSDSISTVTAVGAGGTGTYTYSINSSPIQNNATGIFNVPVGATYAVTVSNSDGSCSYNQDITIAARPARIIVVATGNDNTKTVTGNVTSPAGVYDYRIAPGTAAFTPVNSWSGLLVGVPYTVYAKNTVTGCVDSSAVVTLKNAGPIVVVTDSVCGSDATATGTAKVSINFGTGPYSLNIFKSTAGINGPFTIKIGDYFPVGKTRPFPGLASGYYTVKVRDKNGIANQDTFYIHSKKIVINAETDGDNMSIIVHATGGSKPYTYKLKHIATGVVPISADSVFTSLAKGDYEITATDSKGCSGVITATLNPTKLKVIVKADTVCRDNKGKAQFIISSGAVPYLFKVWQPKDTFVNTALYRQDTTLLNLKAGVYHYRLYDAKSDLERIDSFAIVQTKITIDTVFDRKNMTLTILASGGKPLYSYELNGVSNADPTDNVFTNIKMQTYTIHVTDSRGCDSTITVNLKGTLNVRYTIKKDTVCKTGIDGHIIITPIGGTPDYKLIINNDPNSSYDFADEADINNFPAGSYIFHVEDAVGRTSKDTTINIALDLLSINTPVVDVKNKTIMIHATDGFKPYVYGLDQWSIQNTPPTDSFFTGLVNQKYVAYVQDKYGCQDSTDVSFANPKLLVDVKMVTDTICLNSTDGELVVKPKQAKSSYIMNVGIDLTKSGKFAPFLTNVSFEVSDTLKNLPVGDYSISISDTTGLSAGQLFEMHKQFDTIVHIGAKKPAVIFAEVSSTPTNCGNNDFTGKLSVAISGGKKPAAGYSFNWDGGTNAIAPLDIATLDKAEAGVHVLSVTDNQCTYTYNGIVNSKFPSILIAKDTINSDTITCKNLGKLTLKVSGGAPKATSPRYTYSWSIVTGGVPGAYTTTPIAETDSVIKNIATAGQYFVTVTDNNNCTAKNIIPLDVPQIVSDLSITTEINKQKQTITAHAKGGKKEYHFYIDGKLNLNPKDSVFTGLVKGTYVIKVVDNNGTGCEASTTVDFGNPPLFVDVEMIKDVICLNSDDGVFVVKPHPGVAPYKLNVAMDDGFGKLIPFITDRSFSDATDTIKNVSVGSFHVNIMDAAGYEYDSVVTIKAILPLVKFELVADLSKTTVDCQNNPTGNLVVVVSGGTKKTSELYDYYWDFNSSVVNATKDTVKLDKLRAGGYTLFASDSLCTYSKTWGITSTSPYIYIGKDMAKSDTAMCNKHGKLMIHIAGGTPNPTPPYYNVSWHKITKIEKIGDYVVDYTFDENPLPAGNVLNDTTAINLRSGNYLVLVADASKCTVMSDSLNVAQKNNMIVDYNKFYNKTLPLLNGDSVCYKDTIRITSQAMAVNYTTDNDSIKDATYRWINNFNVASISDDQRTTDLIVDNQSPSYRLYAVSPFDTFCEVDTLIPSVKPYPYPAVYLESPISIGRDGDHIFTPIVYSSVADQNYYWHDKSNYLAATSTELSPTLHFNTNDGSSDTLMFDLSYGKILTSKAQCMLRLSAILNFVGGVDPQSKTLGNNALTPNDDGYNDYWMIKNAEYYPNNHVEIFNRWGQKVYSETGYNNNDKVWRGNYNGGRLPSGVYYYVIKLNSTSKAITGTVTIIR